ncbi:hypothetical protein PhCBS80983_g05724 [Powellomyces hirtus]|uniref:2Fe-2S ferredoxin-type domain-containing protein n=1 Tax=Powellomyces hirtus TaxID=109895 RepID=A0A507DSW7_9FUNG|nr:hypothetical protein PhCBS80983_g05724 [Powellomyces hirtus]
MLRACTRLSSLLSPSRAGPVRRTTLSCLPTITLRVPTASFRSAAILQHTEIVKPKPGEGLKVNYVTPEGERITVLANEGDNLLDLAHAYDVDLEGACEGSLACSTCHVIVEDKYYDMLEEPSDEENDMLDLAFGLTETSRLGCQVCMTKELDGITVKLPSATRNMQVDKER